MEILLQIPGLDINAKDFDGWTALHAAAHWNRETSARMLANAGASFDEHTRAVSPPLCVYFFSYWTLTCQFV